MSCQVQVTSHKTNHSFLCGIVQSYGNVLFRKLWQKLMKYSKNEGKRVMMRQYDRVWLSDTRHFFLFLGIANRWEEKSSKNPLLNNHLSHTGNTLGSSGKLKADAEPLTFHTLSRRLVDKTGCRPWKHWSREWKTTVGKCMKFHGNKLLYETRTIFLKNLRQLRHNYFSTCVQIFSNILQVPCKKAKKKSDVTFVIIIFFFFESNQNQVCWQGGERYVYLSTDWSSFLSREKITTVRWETEGKHICLESPAKAVGTEPSLTEAPTSGYMQLKALWLSRCNKQQDSNTADYTATGCKSMRFRNHGQGRCGCCISRFKSEQTKKEREPSERLAQGRECFYKNGGGVFSLNAASALTVVRPKFYRLVEGRHGVQTNQCGQEREINSFKCLVPRRGFCG